MTVVAGAAGSIPRFFFFLDVLVGCAFFPRGTIDPEGRRSMTLPDRPSADDEPLTAERGCTSWLESWMVVLLDIVFTNSSTFLVICYAMFQDEDVVGSCFQPSTILCELDIAMILPSALLRVQGGPRTSTATIGEAITVSPGMEQREFEIWD